MPIEVTCPSCGKTMNANDSAAGKQANCPDCGAIISIPEPVYDAVEDAAVPGHFDQGGIEPQSPAEDRPRSPCPICGEMIITGVAKCRFCGEYLDSTLRGLWRTGNLLVMEKEAALPDRCLKSNAPATRGLPRTLYWHHPALFILAISPIIYIIVALIVRKQAKIVVGLSEEWFARRRRAIVIGWTSFVLGGLLSCGAPMTLSALDVGDGPAVAGMIAAIVLGLGGIIYGMAVSRIVTPTRITDTHVWLKGVHPAYLADLPEWD